MGRWIVRVCLWVLCGEWLLLFRFWMPPVTFVALGLALFLRLSLVQALPHYAGHYYAWWGFFVLFVVRFLRCFGKEGRRKREHYEAPETGFTWLGKFLGVRPKRTAFGLLVIEPALAFGIAVMLAAFSDGTLVIPQQYFHTQAEGIATGLEEWQRGDRLPDLPSRYQRQRALPLPSARAGEAFLATMEADDIAAWHLLASVAALLVYNVTEWWSWYPRLARVRTKVRREKPVEFFPRVRMPRRFPPALPTVARMARRLARVSR
jgi:hypothetical protein